MLTAVISSHYCGVNVGGEINTQKGRDIVCDLDKHNGKLL